MNGPDPDRITRYIIETYPDATVTRTLNAIFFSCDESGWPNFATIVTTDEHDTWEGGPPPRAALSREGVFRLNIGLGAQTFARIVGAQRDPDYAALDVVMPHPIYGAQHWIGVLNPSDATFERLKPLIDEAHARVAKAAERKSARGSGRAQ